MCNHNEVLKLNFLNPIITFHFPPFILHNLSNFLFDDVISKNSLNKYYKLLHSFNLISIYFDFNLNFLFFFIILLNFLSAIQNFICNGF